MGYRKKLKIMVGIIKGMSVTSVMILKSRLSTKRNTKIQLAVYRATTQNIFSAIAPPSDKRITAVISFGHGSLRDACSCIEALMDRLHATKNAAVALKCLFVIHSIMKNASLTLKDQLSFYPSFGGRNFLNLSTFRDHSDPEMREFSSWARWYAAVIEQDLTLSRFLGHYLSSSLSNSNNKDIQERILAMKIKDLLAEANVLVDFVEVVCQAPDSLHLQRNDLVYEVVRLVGEDYRLVQRETFLQVVELSDRLPSLSLSELAQLLGTLKRFEDCKERLRLLFVNRSRNDALWELISETKVKIIERMKEMKEMKGLVRMERIENSNQLTRFGDQSPSWVGCSGSIGGEWLGLDWAP